MAQIGTNFPFKSTHEIAKYYWPNLVKKITGIQCLIRADILGDMRPWKDPRDLYYSRHMRTFSVTWGSGRIPGTCTTADTCGHSRWHEAVEGSQGLVLQPTHADILGDIRQLKDSGYLCYSRHMRTFSVIWGSGRIPGTCATADTHADILGDTWGSGRIPGTCATADTCGHSLWHFSKWRIPDCSLHMRTFSVTLEAVEGSQGLVQQPTHADIRCDTSANEGFLTTSYIFDLNMQLKHSNTEHLQYNFYKIFNCLQCV